MASPVITYALPRFLLPRISWQAGRSYKTFGALGAITTQRSYGKSSDSHRSDVQSRKPVCESFRFQAGLSILQQLPQRRGFSATVARSRDHHFDTLKFVQRLKEEGFTEEQSVAMMKVLSDVIEERY